MENINDILKNQDNNDKFSQQPIRKSQEQQNLQAPFIVPTAGNQPLTLQQSNACSNIQPTKKKSKQKFIISAIIACLLLVTSFFAYKIVRVNIAYKNFSYDLKESFGGVYSEDVKDAKYLIQNIDFPIVYDDEEDVNFNKSKAFQTAAVNADSFNELKKFYNKAKGKVDDEMIQVAFVCYAINNTDISKEEIEHVCGAMDECVSRILEFKDPAYKDLGQTGKDMLTVMASSQKYYFLYYCGADTTQVKDEIFDLIGTIYGSTTNEKKESQFEALNRFTKEDYENFKREHTTFKID